jgi:hypothetical protein
VAVDVSVLDEDAVAELLEQYPRAPRVPVNPLFDAFALDDSRVLVVGPALDGGVLIGGWRLHDARQLGLRI